METPTSPPPSIYPSDADLDFWAYCDRIALWMRQQAPFLLSQCEWHGPIIPALQRQEYARYLSGDWRDLVPVAFVRHGNECPIIGIHLTNHQLGPKLLNFPVWHAKSFHTESVLALTELATAAVLHP